MYSNLFSKTIYLKSKVWIRSGQELFFRMRKIGLDPYGSGSATLFKGMKLCLLVGSQKMSYFTQDQNLNFYYLKKQKQKYRYQIISVQYETYVQYRNVC